MFVIRDIATKRIKIDMGIIYPTLSGNPPEIILDDGEELYRLDDSQPHQQIINEIKRNIKDRQPKAEEQPVLPKEKTLLERLEAVEKIIEKLNKGG